MATSTDTDLFAKELKDLTAALAAGPKLLTDLPKALQDPEFLGFALAEGRLLIGRPEHWHEHAPGIAESHSERPKRLVVDEKRIAWTALDQSWQKSMYELLAEEEEIDAKLRLRVKLARRK